MQKWLDPPGIATRDLRESFLIQIDHLELDDEQDHDWDDVRATQILGNIRESTFAEMATGPLMRDFMAARPTFCGNCGREHECLGGCKAAAEVCCGDTWAMDPFLSAFGHMARKPG